MSRDSILTSITVLTGVTLGAQAHDSSLHLLAGPSSTVNLGTGPGGICTRCHFSIPEN